MPGGARRPRMPGVSAGRPALIRRLLAPELWPESTSPPELIETHISWVILAGDRAYKIKKPVRLNFVDFRTLAAREATCLEELRLNRRLAPELYEAVLPIGGTPEEPVLDAEPAIEFAVAMRRFPQSALLDAQLAAGHLDGDAMRETARMLAAFHRSLEPAAPSSPHGSPRAVIEPFEETIRDLAGEVGERCAALPSRLAAANRRLTPVFAARKAGGFVRECHGDLHLRNLIKQDGRIVAFDCLEFAPELRWIDVINEAAFLLMDLEVRNAAPLAWRFLDEYLQETGDHEALTLLAYYAAYHAFVRAKVAKLAGDVAEVARYFDLGARSLGKEPGMLILAHGYSGAGKTTVTEPLIETLPAIRLRSDVERKRLAGLPRDAATGSGLEQGLYSEAGTRQTYARLLSLALPAVLAGCNVIVDAAFLKVWQRRPFADAAREARLSPVLLDCVTPERVLRERVARREAGRGVSEAGPEVLERQLAHSDALRDEGFARIGLDTASAVDPEDLARRIRALARRA